MQKDASAENLDELHVLMQEEHDVLNYDVRFQMANLKRLRSDLQLAVYRIDLLVRQLRRGDHKEE